MKKPFQPSSSSSIEWTSFTSSTTVLTPEEQLLTSLGWTEEAKNLWKLSQHSVFNAFIKIISFQDNTMFKAYLRFLKNNGTVIPYLATNPNSEKLNFKIFPMESRKAPTGSNVEHQLNEETLKKLYSAMELPWPEEEEEINNEEEQ